VCALSVRKDDDVAYIVERAPSQGRGAVGETDAQSVLSISSIASLSRGNVLTELRSHVDSIAEQSDHPSHTLERRVIIWNSF
jgi:hypothetical protein